MEYIRVTMDNIEKEHICCAISNNNDIQVASKKAWMKDRYRDGLVFLKSVERGKRFDLDGRGGVEGKGGGLGVGVGF